MATFSGASASTGYITEERTSYISKDLLWGHRFVNMVHYDAENRNYIIDYDEFDITEQVHIQSLEIFFSNPSNFEIKFIFSRSIHHYAVPSE